MLEENFPRGRKPIAKDEKPITKIYKQENLFGVKSGKNEPKKKKSKRMRDEARRNKLQEEVVLPLVEPQVLTYRTIKTQMTILGNIRSVSMVAAEIELPGRIYGFLNMGAISDTLTDRIKAQLQNGNVEEEQELILSNFFEVGQFIPVKVQNMEASEKGMKVELSTKPSVINADLNHSSFRKQMLVWATVIEQLDHGYRLDVGVRNVRVFLQNERVPVGISYKIGQNIWCVVHGCDIAPTAATLKVSALQRHIDTAVENEEDRSLHSVLPGMQFNFDIVTITKNGLLGELLNENKAYVHDMYLQKSMQDVKAFKEGQELKARVLYIEPITKFVFLTLRGIGTVPKPELKVGEILSAKVLGRTNGGIYLQLNESEKGFVTLGRILNSLGKETLANVAELVKEKYPKGKALKCRILDYNRLDAVYICGVEAAVINEKFFTKDDLTLGQFVTAHVIGIKDAGLLVKFGHLQGFINNIHLSNVRYSENIKSRYRVNQKVKARVLSIVNNSIHLTAKPALVESDLCLTTAEQAEIGKQFPGVVIRRGEYGAVVAFYGDVKGFVHSSQLLHGETADARELLFDGQVVNATVIGKNDKGMQLSLIGVKEEDNKNRKNVPVKEEVKTEENEAKKGKLKIGQEVSGTITSIDEKGLRVKIDGKNVEAFMPLHHLSVNYDLNPLLLKTYEVNDKLENLLCIATGKNGPVVSLRESTAYKNQNFSIPKKLQPGLLVRGSVIAEDDKSVTILVPTKTGTHTVHMSKEDLLPETEIETSGKKCFVEQQAVVAKVVSVGKKFTLSTEESDVEDSKIENSLYLLEQYMLNNHRIHSHLLKIGDPLSKYSLGQRVSGVVKKILKGGGSELSLKGGVKGVVDPVHASTDTKPGKRVQGVVLWVDYVHNYVDISLNPSVIDSINVKQDGAMGSFTVPCKAEITLIKENFAICRSNCKKQLVFLPTKLQENNTISLVDQYKANLDKSISVLVYRNAAGCLLGFEKETRQKKQKVEKSVQEAEEETEGSSEEDDEDSVNGTKRKLEAESESGSDEDEAVVNNVKNSKKKQKLETETTESDSEEAEEVNDVKTNGKKRKLETTEQSNSKKKSKKEKVDINFPSMANFFEVDDDNKKEDESSDDDAASVETSRKKKKLTAAERAELARKEEDRLRQIENELADPNKAPESAEQFERIALANPNSSKVWTQYIAFHLSTAEVEKARIVVKRALESIDIEKIQDKLNIWVAYLNLENMFGTKESFEKVFEEATKCNEPYDIYVETIKMFAQTKKLEAMEEKIKKFRGKYKGMPKTWIDITKVYYEMGKFDEARKLKERALKSITDKKQHIDMLVQFAILEFKSGEQNEGEVLFETILSSYPGRIDVWNSYVDQLVKKGCIDVARRVLERATSQRLNLVKMRSLFKKFSDFEKAHGTEETLQQVKDALTEYVARVKSSVDK